MTFGQDGDPSVPEAMAYTLETIMRTPRANRTVSDFLFNSLLQTPFHPAHPLAPSALSTSVTLATAQNIDPKPNLFYPPTAAHTPLSDDLLSNTVPRETMHTELHVIFIPVAFVAPYVVGYAFNHDPAHSPICLRANPFAPPWVSRFVFDTTTSNMLLVTHGGSPASFGIRAMITTPTNYREQYLVTVPALEYEWPNLPTTVLWMISHMEYRMQTTTTTTSTPSTTTSQSEQGTIPLFDPVDLTALDMALEPDPFPSHSMPLQPVTPSLQPWIQTTTGQLTDGTTPMRTPQISMGTAPEAYGTAGASFAVTPMQTALRHLTASISGSFYAPALRMDMPKMMDTGYTTSFTGRSSMIFTVASQPLAAQMRERFASLYYFAVLRVSADAALLAPPGKQSETRVAFGAQSPSCPDCNAIALRDMQAGVPLGDRHDIQTRNIGVADTGVVDIEQEFEEDAFSIFLPNDIPVRTAPAVDKATQKRLRPLAPRLVASTSSSNTAHQQQQSGEGEGEGNQQTDNPSVQPGVSCVGKMQYKDRESMLQARRHRNRLSAARSNDRKKAWVAALEREIEENRRKVKELSNKKLAVLEENKLLRSQVLLNSFLET